MDETNGESTFASLLHYHSDLKLIYKSLPVPIHTAPPLPDPSLLPNFLRFSGLERFRESSNIALNWSFVPQELHVSPIDSNFALGTLLLVFIPS